MLNSMEETAHKGALYASIGLQALILAIHVVLAIYGTLVYIRTPREGQRGRILRITLSNALLLTYLTGTIVDAVKLSSKGEGWMSVASWACDFLLASLYAVYQAYRCHLCLSMRQSRPFVVTALSLMVIAQFALGVVALVSRDHRWSNAWLLSFAVLICVTSCLLGWLILQTRLPVWKALSPGERGSRMLEYLEIVGETASPVALLGILFSIFSFLVDRPSPTGATSFLLSNTVYFAIVSLWPQVLVFRRTMTLYRLHRRPIHHKQLSSTLRSKSLISMIEFSPAPDPDASQR